MCHPHRANEDDLFPLRCDRGISVMSLCGTGTINTRMHHGVWDLAYLKKLQENKRDMDPLNDRRPRENALCNTILKKKSCMNSLSKKLESRCDYSVLWGENTGQIQEEL